ncbi:hypothetical protein ccbrp13_26030 [Ktedonobacteria bacterium brp13]|nr:hypothetical protein ccbrp13_26030 [Ktedonobacteria bacterium brp13]
MEPDAPLTVQKSSQQIKRPPILGNNHTQENVPATPQEPISQQLNPQIQPLSHTEITKSIDEEDTNRMPTVNSSDEEDTNRMPTVNSSDEAPQVAQQTHISELETSRVNVVTNDLRQTYIEQQETQRVPSTSFRFAQPGSVYNAQHPQSLLQRAKMTQGKAALLILLLSVVVIHTLTLGPTQFLSSQGWSYALYGNPNSAANAAALQNYLTQHPLPNPAQSGTKATTNASVNQTIDQIVSKMSLDQKIGQMMMVQFVGPNVSLDMSTMLSQYHVGAVLLSNGNQNMSSAPQLKTLTQQLQQNSPGIPLIIATDQEGGSVNRLSDIYGTRPSATTIGATNDPNQAKTAGITDAQDLAAGGINMNLAPVVDVDNLDASMIHQEDRSFGTTAAAVTTMAGAYLRGLQQSGKVVGVLKHFPGLGDVPGNAHTDVTTLTRSRADLEAIDWAPYRSLINQGGVDAVMVTHDIVPAIDPQSLPSSISKTVIQTILRDDLHFTGVAITDSLTMQGISNLYTLDQASAMAVEAGEDMLMGATDSAGLQIMINGIKQAVSSGNITQAQLDTSVHRILLLKYQMGLLSLHK